MNKRRIATPFVAVMLACVMLVSCTANQITTTLEAVVDATSVALPLVTSLAGLPPQTTGIISAYLGAVNTAVAQAGAELNSIDTNAVKSVKIVGYFTSAGLQLGPNLPSGTPTLAVQIVDAVAKSIANFLVQFSNPTGKMAAASTAKVPIDKKALDRILAKNHSNSLTLQKK